MSFKPECKGEKDVFFEVISSFEREITVLQEDYSSTIFCWRSVGVGVGIAAFFFPLAHFLSHLLSTSLCCTPTVRFYFSFTFTYMYIISYISLCMRLSLTPCTCKTMVHSIKTWEFRDRLSYDQYPGYQWYHNGIMHYRARTGTQRDSQRYQWYSVPVIVSMTIHSSSGRSWAHVLGLWGASYHDIIYYHDMTCHDSTARCSGK